MNDQELLKYALAQADFESCSAGDRIKFAERAKQLGLQHLGNPPSGGVESIFYPDAEILDKLGRELDGHSPYPEKQFYKLIRMNIRSTGRKCEDPQE